MSLPASFLSIMVKVGLFLKQVSIQHTNRCFPKNKNLMNFNSPDSTDTKAH